MSEDPHASREPAASPGARRITLTGSPGTAAHPARGRRCVFCGRRASGRSRGGWARDAAHRRRSTGIARCRLQRLVRECRAYGVRSAMSIARALQLCPQATCVPVPAAPVRAAGRFNRSSRRLPRWCRPRASTSGTMIWAGPKHCTHTSRSPTRHTGFDALCGMPQGSRYRLVAARLAWWPRWRWKWPNRNRGPTRRGVFCVSPGHEVDFMARFRLGDLPMVGPRFVDTLQRMGLETVAEAQAWPRDTLIARLGERGGRVDVSPRAR